jgi:ABC-type branched-subunit amino acid transport system substrate-binding protein
MPAAAAPWSTGRRALQDAKLVQRIFGNLELSRHSRSLEPACSGTAASGERMLRSNLFIATVAVAAALVPMSGSAQVKIGVLNDQSGLYADFAGKWSVEAAGMAVEDFGGIVLSQKIEVVSADHQNKPDLATSIARKWYEIEGLSASPKYRDSAARSKPINQSDALNHAIPAPQRRLSNHRALVKSP